VEFVCSEYFGPAAYIKNLGNSQLPLGLDNLKIL
jgi:hypothetical protein